MTTIRAHGSSRGFSLMEVTLAMTLLALAVLSLLSLTLTVSRQSYSSSGVAYTTAVLQEQSGRMLALPYDSLDTRAGCATVATGPFGYTRCITVSVVNNVKTVNVKVTPTDTRLRADSMVFQRNNPGQLNPFALP